MLQLNDVVQRFNDELALRRPNEMHRECLMVMGISARDVVLYVETAFVGTIQYHHPIIRECLRAALRCDAVSIIVAHNHPSGVSTPSLGDCYFTQALKEACEKVDLNLVDHLILGDQLYSMANQGGLHMNANQIKYGG